MSATQGIDGRRQRGAASRQRIVQAMLELVQEGSVTPSAPDVATRAGVGLRSVFRHFSDMDTLYREMSEEIERRLEPIIVAPYAADHWRDQLDEQLERRARLYDELMPYRICAEVHRFSSEYLQQDHEKLIAKERKALKRILSAPECNRTELLEALDVVTSFDTWHRLRCDQKLSAKRSRMTVAAIVSAIFEN